MKLYTESQVIRMMQLARETYASESHLLFSFDPIELPSDEEIRLKALDVKSNINKLLFHDDSFQFGAHWVIEQIKKQK